MNTEQIVEAATSAYRARGPEGLVVSGAWADLTAEERVEVFERAVVVRTMEAAADPEGLSAAARAVLGRISRG